MNILSSLGFYLHFGKKTGTFILQEKLVVLTNIQDHGFCLSDEC
jgi:hypothetical protein